MFLKKEDKIKKSIDFTIDNIKLLNHYKMELNLSHNEIVNSLIHILLGLDDSIKKKLTHTCLSEINLLEQPTPRGAYEQLRNNEIKEQYQHLIHFLNYGKELPVENCMKKIAIQDGYVIFPDDWVVLNISESSISNYVIVVEVKNGSEYNAPKFIYFTQKAPGTLTDYDCDLIDAECIMKFPAYQRILDDHISLMFDKNHNPINLKEANESPTPGYFFIQEYKKSSYNSYPYGAMIIRKSSENLMKK